MKLKTAHFIAGAIIISAVALPMSVFACSGEGVGSGQAKGKIHMNAVGQNMVMGTVTAISGTTITITDDKGVIYVIDASTATVGPGLHGQTGLSVANILVGDKVVVTGSVSGETKTAKTISDPGMVGRNIFMGKVSAVNGQLLTIESVDKKVKTTYQINAASATILKGMNGTTALILADIKVDDNIFAIGTLSGGVVNATSIRDLDSAKKIAKKAMTNWGKTNNVFRGSHGFGRK